MSSFFVSYSKNTVYNVALKQEFDTSLDKFLNRNRNYHIDINSEFESIETFLTNQPADFFEETFLTTCSKIIKHFSTYNYDSGQISAVQTFISMLKKDKFKDLYPKLENYGTSETFAFIDFLLNNNNILLAETITHTFIPPEKRTLKSFTKTNIVDWCLKNTKIAALKFLINNYEGFNDKNVQGLFLNYGELGEHYLSKVFPDNIYPNSLESSFQTFFKNNSIILSKKLELISYFSKKTDFVPKELVGFIQSGLTENNISIDSLKKHDFFDKLTSKKTLSNFLPYSTSHYVNHLKNYLLFFKNNEDITNVVFELLMSNSKKENDMSNINDFILEFPDFSKEKSKEIQEYVMKNNLDIPFFTFASLKSALVLDEDFNNYLVNKNSNSYFYVKNTDTDPEYIDKCVNYVIEQGSFPQLFNDSFQKSICNKLSQKLNNEQLVNLFFLNEKNSLSNNLPILRNNNVTIVVDWLSLSDQNKELLIDKLDYVAPNKIVNELRPKKWYNLSSEKPLQLIFKNGNFSIITKDKDKVFVSNDNIEESQDSTSTSVSIILSQAKKDLVKFNQLTSEPLDFNLEFKIRSESIFMQQMNFLNQIQKIEEDLKFEDLYFLKNNLGKYLIQCTETYSRALKRHQTLVENPGLFKKQDNTLDSQKEKIDTEALKQVTLLEKELTFVKENIIKTINSDSYSDMRVNTRFLEATVEHDETPGIVKLMTAKPR